MCLFWIKMFYAICWEFIIVNIMGLMPYPSASPGQQQPWYWLWRICKSLSYISKDFNYLCCVNVEQCHKMYIYIYIYVPSEKLAHKGLTTSFVVMSLEMGQSCGPNVLCVKIPNDWATKMDVWDHSSRLSYKGYPVLQESIVIYRMLLVNFRVNSFHLERCLGTHTHAWIPKCVPVVSHL